MTSDAVRVAKAADDSRDPTDFAFDAVSGRMDDSEGRDRNE